MFEFLSHHISADPTADEATHFARELSRLEAMRAAAKKRMNQSYQQYQLQHQPREAAREWDLNDPNHLKKTQVLGLEGTHPRALDSQILPRRITTMLAISVITHLSNFAFSISTNVQAMRTEPIGAPPTLGASSIQVFQGEDPEALQRKRYAGTKLIGFASSYS